MAKPGLQDNSQVTEKIEHLDNNTLRRYRVVEEFIDLTPLRIEKAQLEKVIPQPTDAELIEYGKTVHPYYSVDKERNAKRLQEINKILEDM